MNGNGVNSLKGDDDLIVDPEPDFECEDYGNGDTRNLPKVMYAFGHLINCGRKRRGARFFQLDHESTFGCRQYLVEMRRAEV